MKRSFLACAVVLPLLAIAAAPAYADVKTREKNQTKFEGALGRIVNLFGGGKAVVQTVAVKGDRQATMTDSSGQIIDLAEEKLYEIDVKRKTYKVTTFEELRQRIREAAERAKKDAQEARKEGGAEQGAQLEVDFDVKETGQTKPIAGHDTREVVMTITVREKGKTLDDSGGIVLTFTNWLAKQIPAMKEQTDFAIRFAQKLQIAEAAGVSAEQMASLFAMFPGTKEAWERMQKESVKLQGSPLASTMTIESVKSKAQLAQEQQSGGSGGGGLGGMLARKVMKKDAPKPRSLMLTSNHEIQEVATAVGPQDVAIPADFKEKK